MDIKLTERVRNGEMNDETVWICHYLQPDLNKKPLRNVPPTKCMVMSNEGIKKTVYYSKSHYRPINAKGKVLAKVISPVDATGHRGYCGNMLYTFDNEADCVKAWNEMLEEVMERVQIEIDTAENFWRKKKDTLNSMLEIVSGE